MYVYMIVVIEVFGVVFVVVIVYGIVVFGLSLLWWFVVCVE